MSSNRNSLNELVPSIKSEAVIRVIAKNYNLLLKLWIRTNPEENQLALQGFLQDELTVSSKYFANLPPPIQNNLKEPAQSQGEVYKKAIKFAVEQALDEYSGPDNIFNPPTLTEAKLELSKNESENSIDDSIQKFVEMDTDNTNEKSLNRTYQLKVTTDEVANSTFVEENVVETSGA